MTDTGLTNRLRQRSRRAGIMVGLSMALTIAICLGGFVWLYAEINPFTQDFVAANATSTPEEPPRETREASQNSNEEPAENAEEPTPEEPDSSEPDPTPTAEPTPTSEAFQPTHQANSQFVINLRAGPSTDTEIVTALALSQPLEYLDEDAPTENPAADGNRWMKFRTEDGLEGWIREIDAEPYQAN
jgi:cytoskeletal protein RodZ